MLAAEYVWNGTDVTNTVTMGTGWWINVGVTAVIDGSESDVLFDGLAPSRSAPW